MKKDLQVSSINTSHPENHIRESPINAKKSIFSSTSSRVLKNSGKPIFAKESIECKNRSEFLMNIENIVPNNHNNVNNTECSFMTCIDNDTKVEIKSLMTVMKNEILEMYTSMIGEIRKDFKKKCEDVKRIESLVDFKLKKIEKIEKEVNLFSIKTNLNVFLKKFKDINDVIQNISTKMEEIKKNEQKNDLSLLEEYRKQIEGLIAQKTGFLTEDYNSLARFAAKLEDSLKTEFEGKIAKILNEINHDGFMKILKESSNEFEFKLKSTFEDLNSRIKGFEERIQTFQKRKEEVFWTVKNDFERKFKEGESYFMTQLNVFKNMLNNKIESKDFKNIMQDLIESKSLELRSELFTNQNTLSGQIEEIKNIKENAQNALDSLNSEVKEILTEVAGKVAQVENSVGNDRNEMANFQEKINEIQDKMSELKESLHSLKKESETRIAKENEEKNREFGEMKEINNKIKEKEKKTEKIINEIKKENQFSKINQLEMLVNELNSNVARNQEEGRILLDSLKNKVGILSLENTRLKERETVLLREIDEMNKKQEFLMLSLEHKKDHENRSDTATNSHSNTNIDKLSNYHHSSTKPTLPKNPINTHKPFIPELKKEKIEKTDKNLHELLDQFEDYEEENSDLSQGTENDVFFYPNNQNHSILSNSSKMNEPVENPNKLNNLRFPSPLLKNPFDDEILGKNSDFTILNRMAITKKDFSKQEKAITFKDGSNNGSKMSPGTNFYDHEKLENIFKNETSTLKKTSSKFSREEFDQLMRLEYFFKKSSI